MSQTMYEIIEQLHALDGIDGTDEDMAQAVKDMWESTEIDLATKANGYARVIAELYDEVARIKEETARLDVRAASRTKKAEYLVGVLKQGLIAAKKDRLTTPFFTFTIAINPGKTIIDDTTKIPQKYVSHATTSTIDKTAITAALKAGDAVPGAHLEQGESLRIK